MKQPFRSAAIAVSLVTALCASISSAQPVPGEAPVQVRQSDDGAIYVTPAGMSLYVSPQENSKSDKFRWGCLDTASKIMSDQQTDIGERPRVGGALMKTCVQKYPPYLAAGDARPIGEFTILTRPEGTRQWAHNGFPLYTHVNDKVPGDRTGGGPMVGPGGSFRLAVVAPSLPPGLSLARREGGMILTTSGGVPKVLYTPKGGRIHSAAVGFEPLEPLLAPAFGIAHGRWTAVDAGAGRKQFAFDGKPLYLAPEAQDEAEMETSGQWELVYHSRAKPRPRQISTQFTLVGDLYTTVEGKTLYTYVCGGDFYGGDMGATCADAGDPANFMVMICGDGKECAKRWRPYLASATSRPSGDWSVVEITDPPFTDPRGALYPSDAPKVEAWAYRGRPVYTFHQDEQPGDIWGANMKGLWGSRFGYLMVPGRNAFRD